MSKRKTHEDFVREMRIINNNIIILSNYIKANEIIDVKCLKCNGEWSPIASSLLNGNGCPYCCIPPRRVLIGINDLHTTNPEISKNLLNHNDGFKYTKGSGEKVDWICSNCNNIIYSKTIKDVVKRGLSCNVCSDGISYPEKFMISLLNQLNISFKREYKFTWSDNKRYDFYIKQMNLIIEIHGLQHYEGGFDRWNIRARNASEEKFNDEYKEKIAKQNNIKNYIIIDAKYSSIDYIKQSILNSELNVLYNLQNINWNKCHEEALKSNKIIACELYNNCNSVTEIMKIMKYSRTSIITWLKECSIIGICKYIPNDSKRGRISLKRKKVICIETGLVFNSIQKASENVINGSDSHISQCCIGKRNTCGRLSDGTPLHWKYG